MMDAVDYLRSIETENHIDRTNVSYVIKLSVHGYLKAHMDMQNQHERLQPIELDHCRTRFLTLRLCGNRKLVVTS